MEEVVIEVDARRRTYPVNIAMMIPFEQEERSECSSGSVRGESRCPGQEEPRQAGRQEDHSAAQARACNAGGVEVENRG